jgi:hypothetical protein
VYGLDIVAVGIEKKGCVIPRPVIRPGSRSAVVPAAGRNACPVESRDGGAIAGPESDVDRARRLRRLR